MRADAAEFCMTFLYGLLSDHSIMAPLQSQGAGEDHEHRSDGNQRKRASLRDEGQREGVFKGPATLYALRMMPDGKACVLTSSNVRGGVRSAKKRFPVPNKIG